MADSYANAIPSFMISLFGEVARTISFVQIETGFLCQVACGDGARWCSGHCFFDHMIQQRVFGLKKFKPTPTTAISDAAKRRAECTSRGP